MLALFFNVLTEEESGTPSGEETNQTEKITETLKNMIKSPVFYIVIGAILLLIIAFYLYRKFIRNREGNVTIITRKGNIHKVLEGNGERYFLVPFADKVGAVISLKEKELNSDKLFINNGPDALYKVNFTLTYKVTDPKEYFKFSSNIESLLINKLNEDLREFADKGNAMILVRDYRDNAEVILNLINKAVEEYFIEVSKFKINLIEPLGKK